jgi:hypothetical protein
MNAMKCRIDEARIDATDLDKQDPSRIRCRMRQAEMLGTSSSRADDCDTKHDKAQTTLERLNGIPAFFAGPPSN